MRRSPWRTSGRTSGTPRSAISTRSWRAGCCAPPRAELLSCSERTPHEVVRADAGQLELGPLHGEAQPLVEARGRRARVAPQPGAALTRRVIDAGLEQGRAVAPALVRGEHRHAAQAPLGGGLRARLGLAVERGHPV